MRTYLTNRESGFFRSRFTFTLLASFLIAFCGLVPKAEAQYLITTANLNEAIIYENFNSYRGNAATVPSTGNWTLNGFNNSFQGTGTGTGTTGGLYAYGVNNDDRSFGFLANGSTVNQNATAQFTNTSGYTITSFVLSFTGEEWRRISGATSQITVFYGTTLAGTTTALGSSTWLPANGANANGSLISSAIITADNTSINLANGESLFIRFAYMGGSGTREGLSFDDLTVTFNAEITPASGNFWVGDDTTLGGSGTWTAAGGTSWRTTDTNGLGGAFDEAQTATFGGTTSGTVTVIDTVNANNGIQFNTTGYVVSGGTINLGGASALANTIATDSGVTATISSILSGSNGLTKAGAGTLILNGDNIYTGVTAITDGILALGASGDVDSTEISVSTGATLDLTAKSSSGYTLGSGVTLSGSGTVTTASGQGVVVGAGAFISPGTSAATSGNLTVSDLTFAGGGTYTWTLSNVSGSAGTGWDLLTVTNGFSITATSGNQFIIDINGVATGFNVLTSDSWTILTGIVNDFDASVFSITNTAGIGTDGVFSLTSNGTSISLVYTAPPYAIYRYTGGTNGAWLTAGNWNPTAPGSTGPTTGSLVRFDSGNTASAVGINFGNSTNNGTRNTAVGAIELTSTRSTAIAIGNSSGTAGNTGTLTLTGLTIGGIDNVVLRNASSVGLTLQNVVATGTSTMTVALGNAENNVVVIDGSGGITISSVISGSGRQLTKRGNGEGAFTLSGANTYSGGTTISEGTLIAANASALGTGTVSVEGGTLATTVTNLNTGNFNMSEGAFSLNGASTGTLTLSTGADMVWTGGLWNLSITSLESFDHILGGGAGSEFAISDVALNLSGTIAEGTYAILTGFTNGTASFSEITGAEGYFTHTSVTGGVLTLTISLTVIPEPHEYAMMIAGFLGLLIVVRRMRQRANAVA